MRALHCQYLVRAAIWMENEKGFLLNSSMHILMARGEHEAEEKFKEITKLNNQGWNIGTPNVALLEIKL